ncbi:MAG: ATP-dependent DNA helicase [Patescibacteria group bacterium]
MDSQEFTRAYKNLNLKQKEAVDAIEGPIMVIAGPGTGKTTILTLRIAQILRKTDTPASGILAITYTEAGVKAMRQKLRQIIGSRADEVRIHTFHNFASSVIGEFRDHFVHLDRTTQLSDIEAESLIRELLETGKFRDLRPFGNPDFYIQKIISAISDSKREAYTPEMIRAFVADEKKRIENDEESVSTRGSSKGELKAEAKKEIEKGERTLVFADLYEAYENKKREDRKMDFDDLIIELLLALRKDELLLRMLQEKFLYLLVDEHQDTNNSQNEIIKLLANFFDVPNIFIVGDEKQSIYRFQGASVENFLKFQSLWKDLKIINLEANYRSHQKILDASFSMIENNYANGEHENLRIKLQASGEEESRPVDIVSGKNTETIEEYLISELRTILKKEPKASVALITKTNRDLERVLRLCETNNVPVSSERSVDIFSHPIGSLFFDLAEFLYDPSQLELFAKTLIAGLWGVTFENSVELLKLIKAGKKIDFSKFPELKILQKEITSNGAFNFIILLAEKSGYAAITAREPEYVEVWRGITTLAENLIREADLTDPRELLKRLIAYKTSAENRSIKISVGTPDTSIRAMTAHGSKGLEFDYVYIPYATEESWIGRNWGYYFVLPKTRTANEVPDVRRLFYVALTRARKHVTILFGEEEHGDGLLPLRFIDELDPAHTSRISLPAGSVKKVSETKVRSLSDHSKKTLEYAKHLLQTSGLSVTALNHFLECPSAFLYQSILKLPQAPAATAEKGNAMHLAFSKVWGSVDKSKKNIEKILTDTTEYYFSESLLPLFEKEAVKKELLRDIPIVARELEFHFAQEGKIFSETWSESEFKGKHQKQEVVIPVHGKIDAIVDSGKEAKVFDYKTKKAMSENEIRGNTKNSNGDYFRQLVFYRLLLEHDSRFTGRLITPSLVFAVPDDKGRCPTITLAVEKTDLEKIKAEIQSLIDSVWSGSLLTDRCEDPKCEWCKLKAILLA